MKIYDAISRTFRHLRLPSPSRLCSLGTTLVSFLPGSSLPGSPFPLPPLPPFPPPQDNVALIVVLEARDGGADSNSSSGMVPKRQLLCVVSDGGRMEWGLGFDACLYELLASKSSVYR